MSGKEMRNRLLIGFGLLLAMIVTVWAVVAYVYWEEPSKAISGKQSSKAIARTVNDQMDMQPADAAEGVPSPDVTEDNVSANRIIQNDAETAGKGGGPLYASVPDRTKNASISSHPESTGRSLRNPMQWPARDMHPPVLPKNEKRGTGLSGVSTPASRQSSHTLDVTSGETESSPGPGENVTAENAPDDTGSTNPVTNPDDNSQNAGNYTVSVTRNINTGQVVLSVSLGDGAPNGLIINEFIPAGWQMTSASPAPLNCWSFPCSGNMKWLFITQTVGTDITYTIEKTGSVSGSAISGNYLYKDPASGLVTATITGQSGV